MTHGLDAERALRKTSQLRRLCLSLPHIATAAERRLLARFEEIVAAPSSATGVDVPAVTAGWRAWWRVRRFAEIVAMADCLPPDFVDGDRDLATYAVAARAARAESR